MMKGIAKEVIPFLFLNESYCINNNVMRSIDEVEKRLNAIAGFKTIESLEAMIPETECTDEKEESIDDWIRINIGEEYLNIDRKFE